MTTANAELCECNYICHKTLFWFIVCMYLRAVLSCMVLLCQHNQQCHDGRTCISCTTSSGDRATSRPAWLQQRMAALLQ